MSKSRSNLAIVLIYCTDSISAFDVSSFHQQRHKAAARSSLLAIRLNID
ncbi:hypothetical protein [Chamaesiphon sp. VAR_48_metabat_403]|nr:hypothetical protein [Chamaesiphon sp. VAR_48_metabat_403]